MNLERLIPDGLTNYLRLLRRKTRYPDSNIASYSIAKDARVGSGCCIHRDVDISTGVDIGKNCVIHSNVVIGQNVTIGEFSYVNTNTMISSGRIGKYCSIASFCQIGMQEHPVNYLSTSPSIYGKNNIIGLPALWDDISSPPEINNDVWIGAQSVIMQGVHIGDGAVIGAGAVVTRDVPPYAIVTGVPAKIRRYRFSDEAIEYLLELKWWDLPIENIKTMREIIAAKEAWFEKVCKASDRITPPVLMSKG
jgi:acetyltransferase-like isoleucine patch superfamily enzyme